MADSARQPVHDLAFGAPLSEKFDFFELMRRLEREGGLFGHGGSPDHEPARLGQQVRQVFTARDIAGFQPGDGDEPARVSVANIGLLGPEGPMPLHLTRWVLDRISQRWFADGSKRETADTTFVDFINILQHRMIALFYRAWADQHVEAQVERRGGGPVGAMLKAMSGIGMPGTGGDVAMDYVRLAQAAALASQVEGPEKLTGFLAEAFGVPVELKEFIGNWLEIPKALQTRLAMAHAGLARGATIGPRCFQRQSRIELRVGPLGLKDFKSFLPGSPRLAALKKAIRELVGGNLDVDLRILLARDEMPSARLGDAQLGRVAWLAPRREGPDAEDMLMRVAIGWRSEVMMS